VVTEAVAAANPSAITGTKEKLLFYCATVRLIGSTKVLPTFVEDDKIVWWSVALQRGQSACCKLMFV